MEKPKETENFCNEGETVNGLTFSEIQNAHLSIAQGKPEVAFITKRRIDDSRNGFLDFQRVYAGPEYNVLNQSEYELLTSNKVIQLLEQLFHKGKSIIDLGIGDGKKICALIMGLTKKQKVCGFDLSGGALQSAKGLLEGSNIENSMQLADITRIRTEVRREKKRNVTCIGSLRNNLSEEQQQKLLEVVRSETNEESHIVISGFKVVKGEEAIQKTKAAYGYRDSKSKSGNETEFKNHENQILNAAEAIGLPRSNFSYQVNFDENINDEGEPILTGVHMGIVCTHGNNGNNQYYEVEIGNTIFKYKVGQFYELMPSTRIDSQRLSAELTGQGHSIKAIEENEYHTAVIAELNGQEKTLIKTLQKLRQKISPMFYYRQPMGLALLVLALMIALGKIMNQDRVDSAKEWYKLELGNTLNTSNPDSLISDLKIVSRLIEEGFKDQPMTESFTARESELINDLAGEYEQLYNNTSITKEERIFRLIALFCKKHILELGYKGYGRNRPKRKRDNFIEGFIKGKNMPKEDREQMVADYRNYQIHSSTGLTSYFMFTIHGSIQFFPRKGVVLAYNPHTNEVDPATSAQLTEDYRKVQNILDDYNLK